MLVDVENLGSLLHNCHGAFSAVGHTGGMTKPGDSVWQCWECNSRSSAVLYLAETITRDDSRADAMI